MKATKMPPGIGGNRRLWWARPAIANLSRVPFPLQTPQNRGPSRQTPRLDLPHQFQRRLSQAAA
jgi:hypothetical protein